MTKVTYLPPAEDSTFPACTEQFGYKFEVGKPVEVTDERHLGKFMGNRFFVVGDVGEAHSGMPLPLQSDMPPIGAATAPALDGSVKALMTVEQATKLTENATKAAAEGKARSVPVAYHKYEGGPNAWLAAYDAYQKPE